jgi:hypothetical protein
MADENPKPMALTGTIKVPINVPNHQKEYLVQISAPGPMVPLEDLERALEHNRDQLRKASEEIKETVRKEIVDQPMPFLLNYDSPTQLAIMAHLNINVLVPIINMKGGDATYNKPETMNVKDHVERLHNMAQRNVLENLGKEHKPFQMAILSAILIAMIILFMLSSNTN